MRLHLLLGFVLAVGLAACGDSNDDPPATTGCKISSDCKIGFECVEAQCVPVQDECKTADDCEEGSDCVDGECVAAPACTENTDCGPGLECVEGECVEEEPACVDDEQCEPGFECLEGECVAAPECSETIPCEDGFECVEGECVAEPECSETIPCEDGFECVEGACVAEPECSDTVPCETGFECIEGECVAEEPECSETEPCEDGFRCEEGSCVEDLCFVVTCDGGLACDPADGVCKCGGEICGEEAVCIDEVCTVCNDENQCTDGLVCDTTVAGGACVECVVNEDCSDDGSLICDTANNTCVSRGTAEMQAIRAAAWDTQIELPLTNVYVTYIKPYVGELPLGFWVQAEQNGPAIFVAIDPAAISEEPAVGDRVSFTVTETRQLDGQTVVKAIDFDQAAWILHERDVDVAFLAQDISDEADIISNLGAYEAKLVSIRGTLASEFEGAGSNHIAAQLETSQIAPSNALRLRTIGDVRDALDLEEGCDITVTGPMWRFGANAQPSAYEASDIVVHSCPAPTLVSALALSPTEVVVEFSRQLDETTVEAADFEITPALAIDSLSVDGKTVTLVVERQEDGETYTVDVVAEVKDMAGVAVALPASQTFTGVGVMQAEILLTEANVAITGKNDAFEFYVTEGGTLSGLKFTVHEPSPNLMIAFPAVTVATGDFIVVHVGASAALSPETTKDEFSSADFSRNIDGAWDFLATGGDISFSARVFAIENAAGDILSAVAFAHQSNTPPGSFTTAVQNIQASGHWLPADCDGSPCTTSSTPKVQQISANWTSIQSSMTGTSVQRLWDAGGPIDTMQASDWTQAASTWGSATTAN